MNAGWVAAIVLHPASIDQRRGSGRQQCSLLARRLVPNAALGEELLLGNVRDQR